MAVNVEGSKVSFTGLAADVKPLTGFGSGSTFTETDTSDIYVWDGDSWELHESAGNLKASDSQVKVVAATHIGEIFGYKVIEEGTGVWTFSPSVGVDYTLTAAQVAVLKGFLQLEHLDSIIVGTGGTAILNT